MGRDFRIGLRYPTLMNIYDLKLKAGALQYTIFVSVIIALLVFAFISLTYVQNKLWAKTSIFQEVVHNTNEGFNYLGQHKIPYNDQIKLPLIFQNNLETTIIKDHWGIFDIATSTSKRNNETFTKTALLGGYQQHKTSLYLQDINQPLVVVGKTRIEGRVYLPELGIKRGTIAGHSYTGKELIYGTVAQSDNNLPEIQNIKYFKMLYGGTLSKKDKEFIELEENTKLVNSFSEPTKIVYSHAPIALQFIELTGNIVIYSDLKIKIYPSAILKDIILIAPEIEIYDYTKGNFQVFAIKKITVGKNCELAYPSAIILTEGDKSITTTIQYNIDENPQVVINKGSDIKGIVAFVRKDKAGNYKPQIIIDENAVVTGEVYCNKNIELKGTIKGSVYTKGFIANQFGSVYKNHIYNGKILGNDLPQQYCGLSFKDTKPKIAKWLYY